MDATGRLAFADLEDALLVKARLGLLVLLRGCRRGRGLVRGGGGQADGRDEGS